MSPARRPVSEPSAWRGADMACDPSWIITLDTAARGELDLAMRAVTGRRLRAATFTRDDFPLPRLAALMTEVLDVLEHGRGFVLLRGLPTGDDVEAAAAVLWGVGCHLGRALPQHERVNLGKFRDHLIAHITDQGFDYGAPNVNGSLTSAEQMPHSDPADVVALFCLRAAMSGGISRIVSATTVHNTVLAEQPDLLEALYEGFHHHLRDQQVAGGGRLTPQRMPVFSDFAGRLSCIFNSRTVLAAEQVGHALTASEHAALDAMLEIAQRPDLRLDMDLRPGDLQLLNNYTILHSRTGWTDHPDPARKRLMLRLWLRVPNARALAPGFAGGYVAGARHDVAAVQ